MAASVKVLLRRDKINANGEAPVYLRIIKHRSSQQISLGIVVHEKFWDDGHKRVKKGHPNSQRLNNYIAHKVAEAEGQALELETTDKSITTNKIKEQIMGAKSPSFFYYAKTYFKLVKGRIAGSTYEKTEGIVNKMHEYIGLEKDLSFEELNIRFLKEYEHYMRNDLGNSNNTVFANFKIIRRIVNEAVKDEVIPYNKNPFLKFKFKWEKTVKHFCSEEELALIENVELKAPKLFHTRNAYVLSSYAGGIRISDICNLKKRNYDGERIFIYTKKCKGVPVSIKLPQKAKEILDIYCKPGDNPDHFVFPFLDDAVDYSDEWFLTKAIDSVDTLCNKHLKDITDLAGVDKHLTFHTSRHTWATRALRKGMRIEYVSKLMGHADIKTTQIYAKIVNEELDNAMDVFNESPLKYTSVAS